MAFVPANAGFPSGTNTFAPNHAASQSLIVGFSRNPKTFALPRYAQYVRAGNNVGLYRVWTSQEGARITTSDDAEHNWSDGEAAPPGNDELESWVEQSFVTIRKAYPYTMGQMAVEQADFNIIAAMAGVTAQKCMTARSLLTANALSNTTWGNNGSAVNNGILPSGHDWTTGSADTENSGQGPNILVSFQYAERIIHQGTIGVVQPDMTAFVCNPFTAQKMAASSEIRNFLKQSPMALAQVRGDVPNQNGKWGLPDTLYGHPVVVEDAVYISSRKGVAPTTSYVIPNGTAYFIARDGELEGVWGARSFSTIQIFFFQDEMTVETKYDADNRRYQGRVVTNFVSKIVAPVSGFQFTAATPSS